MSDKNRNKSLSSANNQNSPRPTKAKFTLAQLIEKFEQQGEELRCLREFSDAQATHIINLEEKYSSMELKLKNNELAIEHIQSISALKDNVIVKLQQQINKQEQISRRPCAMLVGIPKEKGESPDDLKKEVSKLIDKTNGKLTMADVDKFHRDGPRFGAKQDIIVRFHSHSAKETFYKSRKSIIGDNESLKIRPSLTKSTKKLLGETNDTVEEFKRLSNPPLFILPDVHGNLMIKFKLKSRVGLFCHFDNMDMFRSKVYQAQHSDETDNEFDAYDVSDSEDEVGF